MLVCEQGFVSVGRPTKGASHNMQGKRAYGRIHSRILSKSRKMATSLLLSIGWSWMILKIPRISLLVLIAHHIISKQPGADTVKMLMNATNNPGTHTVTKTLRHKTDGSQTDRPSTDGPNAKRTTHPNFLYQ